MSSSNQGSLLPQMSAVNLSMASPLQPSHTENGYPFPVDEREQEREALVHQLMVLLCQKRLFYAPIEKALKHGGHVLDLGRPSLPPTY